MSGADEARANGESADGAAEDFADGGIKPLAVSDPARIGPYLLLGRLGAGGMGRVFLARNERGRTVAVKVVHEEHVSDAQFRARFRKEIEAARRVGARHTAPVLDAGPEDEPPWVATGYVPGLSLEQVVRRHGPLPYESVHALAEGLLKALEDIHGAGIVHRDLKPSNVMLTVDGTKVIDFGIARALDASVESLLTSTGMAIGSPGFMSPEQVQGQRAGVGSDVFTLGCVLTYAATGQLPFGHGASNQHAVMYQIVEGEPDLTRVEDTALRALIERCLTKDVAGRPGVAELLADPERVRPAVARGAWLPAAVVARLAQQSAKLLDAEAAPLREAGAAGAADGAEASHGEEASHGSDTTGAASGAGDEPVDRATVGLRGAAPVAAGAGTSAVGAGLGATSGAKPRQESPRRRRTLIALPIVAVLALGGGTVAILQPFGSDKDGDRAERPGNSASATPGDSESPRTPSSSPSDEGKDGSEDKEKDGGGEKDKGEDEDGKGGGGTGGDGDGDGSQASGGSGGPGSTDGGAASGGGSSDGSGGSGGSGSGSGSGGGSDSNGSGDGGSATKSPPPDLKSYEAKYVHGCFGACDMPVKVSWSAIPQATRYDIHYTNTGSNFTEKNVDTTYSTSGTSYTINGPFSGDRFCVTVRAANAYGPSAWAEKICDDVPPS
ncbi:protein kinase domain-containing protein [Streptomyces sp. KLOTTS4A1]|uniref:protein kinase domain-containing protein n=1 Tax=Streptomyces sp. KLOTTS4A1 TaxID=3390996 RepID=UPI0039F59F1D